MGAFDEKNRSQKSHASVPLRYPLKKSPNVIDIHTMTLRTAFGDMAIQCVDKELTICHPKQVFTYIFGAPR